MVCALDRAYTVPDDNGAKSHGEGMKCHRETTALEPVPDALRCGVAEGEGLDCHLDEVIDAPAGHDRVVKHDGCRHEADESTHPGEFLPGNFCERANHTHAAFSPQHVLRDD